MKKILFFLVVLGVYHHIILQAQTFKVVKMQGKASANKIDIKIGTILKDSDKIVFATKDAQNFVKCRNEQTGQPMIVQYGREKATSSLKEIWELFVEKTKQVGTSTRAGGKSIQELQEFLMASEENIPNNFLIIKEINFSVPEEFAQTDKNKILLRYEYNNEPINKKIKVKKINNGCKATLNVNEFFGKNIDLQNIKKIRCEIQTFKNSEIKIDTKALKLIFLNNSVEIITEIKEEYNILQSKNEKEITKKIQEYLFDKFQAHTDKNEIESIIKSF